MAVVVEGADVEECRVAHESAHRARIAGNQRVVDAADRARGLARLHRIEHTAVDQLHADVVKAALGGWTAPRESRHPSIPVEVDAAVALVLSIADERERDARPRRGVTLRE